MQYLTFILTQTARNFRQTWGAQLMTLLTVTISVLFFTFFFLIYNNMLQAASKLGDELRLIVYLDKEIKPSLRPGYENKIRSFNEVDQIVFVSPEDAFAGLKKQLGNDRDVLDDLNSSFLPHSIEIYLKQDLQNLTRIKDFSEYLSTLPGATKVQYGHGWIERFGSFINLLRMIVLLSGILLTLTATFMVSYTIRLTLVARQEELEVFRMLGASNSFIKGPVLIEGFLQGLFGSTMGLTALYFCYLWLTNHFSGPNLLHLFEFSFLPLPHSLVILLTSILLCTAGSLVSIRKYVRI